MTKTVLQTFGLTKKYGEYNALDNVSLTLKQGEIYGLDPQVRAIYPKWC